MIVDGNTKEFKIEDIRLKILMYGGPGTGKTWFGATMPNPFFIFHQTTEDGLLYYKMRGMDIDYAGFETFADLHGILDSIITGQRAQGAGSIILDGWDRLDQPLLQEILNENGATKMTQPMWGVARDRLKDLSNRFLNLGRLYHIAILAGDMMEKNELSGQIYGLPNTIGRFRQEIGGLFDLYLYAVQDTYWDNGEQKATYKVHTVKYLDFGAKDRTGVFDFQEDNDFSLLYKKFTSRAEEIRAAVRDGTEDVLQCIPLSMRKLLGLPQVLEEPLPASEEPSVIVE